MVDRIYTVPRLGDLPGLVIDMLRAQVADSSFEIGDGEASERVPTYPHAVVYTHSASAMPGQGGVDHERIQRATIQLKTVGENRLQCDRTADDLAALIMDRTIRPRTWVNELANARIVVIDRVHLRGQAIRDQSSPTWNRDDNFQLVVSPV